ncbi:TIGR01244 family sulfur transferase [Parablastomonas sp. CN1-191]|uniref:TIGR01244 family sulfur transferase n=1 Tax=Parablastomonas sp. CN1-191 TaxID=3400908 RepID=UPI003BF91E00
MTDFRPVTDKFLASPQIAVADVAAAKALGVTLIVNNRPEGESPDQVPGAAIAAEAQAQGLSYVAIPVTHAGFSQAQVDAMAQALSTADGKVLAYCRSGTRSTLLWALAEASRGREPGEIASAAASAGYDVTPIATMLSMLAARAGG